MRVEVACVWRWCGLVVLIVSDALAATMTLPGTGFDANGNALGNYGVDANWTVSGSQYGGSAAYVIVPPGDPDCL